jgi:hypothetical protein
MLEAEPAGGGGNGGWRGAGHRVVGVGKLADPAACVRTETGLPTHADAHGKRAYLKDVPAETHNVTGECARPLWVARERGG